MMSLTTHLAFLADILAQQNFITIDTQNSEFLNNLYILEGVKFGESDAVWDPTEVLDVLN